MINAIQPPPNQNAGQPPAQGAPQRHDFIGSAANYFKLLSLKGPLRPSKGMKFRIVNQDLRLVKSSTSEKIARLAGSILPKAIVKRLPDSWIVHNPTLDQNRETVESFLDFMIAEVGPEKTRQIEKDLKFSFAEMIKKGEALDPKLVYRCNLGMNLIEMPDVEQFYNRLKAQANGEAVQFTEREIRGMERVWGDEIPDFPENAPLAQHLSEDLFDQLMDVLQTPDKDWKEVFTGKEFHGHLKGGYHKKRGIKSLPHFHARPDYDMHETLHIMPMLKNAKTHDEFMEILIKLFIKRHLIKVNKEHEWRVGSLIQTPPDANGKRHWLRVDEGVDSGLGKYWIALRPACDNADPSVGVYRVYRDTSPKVYQQGTGYTLVRDIYPSEPAGYKHHDSTAIQDKQFFEEFTRDVSDKSPPEAVRPLYLVSNSLGAFDAQYDLVKYTAGQNRIPKGSIHLYSHSGVRIKKEDNDQFVQFMNRHKNLMKKKESQVTIDHIIEDCDIVPKAGDNHTYLGRGYSKAKLRVYQIKRQNPYFKRVPDHIRRLEPFKNSHLRRLNYSFASWDKRANNTNYESFRRKGGRIIHPIINGILAVKRFAKGRRGTGRAFGSHAAHVVYRAGESRVQFYSPEQEKASYKASHKPKKK